MAKYILFGSDGSFAGRFDSAHHGTKIPSEAMEISDELFWQTINEQDGIWSLIDNKVIKLSFPDKTAKQKRAEIQGALMALVTNKHRAAKKLVLGHKSTPEQEEIYKDLYAQAKAGLFDGEENTAIIRAHETAVTAIRQFSNLINEFRAAVDKLIDADKFDAAQMSIDAAQAFDATTKRDDVLALFESVG